MKLTNVGNEPKIIDEGVLSDAHNLRVVISDWRDSAGEGRPFSRRCLIPAPRVLEAGESLSSSFFVGAGLGGWTMAEPGAYTIRVRLELVGAEVSAEPLRLRVASQAAWDEELIAQDFLTEDVGRALAFGGTYVIMRANEALMEAAERLVGRAVARHAAVALAQPLARDRKVLRLPDGVAPASSVAADGGRISVVKANPEEASRLLRTALGQNGEAAEVFGQVALTRYERMYERMLAEMGEPNAGGKDRSAREDPSRGIQPSETKAGKRKRREQP